DEGPGNIEVVADRGAIIPVLKRLACRDEPLDVATKGNDVVRPYQDIPADTHGANRSNVDAATRQPLDHMHGNLGIRLWSRRRSLEGEASLPGQAVKILRGHQALCRCMLADEGDGLGTIHGS